ncbi:MerR family transcriptional regulator [Streptomyces sp. NBC_00237]|uniref:MerR family transcriptional regulator n=1 Tax=Streptomyces sp. NBC_00237 TaxID=2975687 RepID=UPI002258F0DA|nr:MerR family transcriptional regulator [Streptomyces sp. NBC_00237]MCX5205606.1 MerR family transcriptional regulator [Streptomyces sp. NBC_00237]
MNRTTQTAQEPGEASFSTGEVARRLGVSPTTVRSWDRRYGIGAGTRTQGSHRRWSPQDMARLERMCGLTATGVPPAEAARLAVGSLPPPPVVPSPAPAPTSAGGRAGEGMRLGGVRAECRGVVRAALRLDAGALDELLTTVIRDLGLVTAWTEVIMPALHAAGRKWEGEPDRYVEVEHFLSWHVSGALRRAGPPLPPGKSRGAVTLLACAPQENHTLPLEVLAASLTERALPVRMFGAALPAESLLGAVERTGPVVVGLWAQSRATADRTLADRVADLRWGPQGARRKPSVLALGPGWSGTSAHVRPHGLAEAVATVEARVAQHHRGRRRHSTASR